MMNEITLSPMDSPMKKLGSGTFSNVYLAYTNNNKKVAVKIPNDVLSKKRAMHESKNEIRILNKFKPSNYIINLIAYSLTEGSNCLVFELLGDELYTLWKYYRAHEEFIPIKVVKNIIKQVLHGLVELKERDVLHNDLKTENILFTEPLAKIFKCSKKTYVEKIYTLTKLSYRGRNRFLKNHINVQHEVLREILLMKMNVKISDFGNSFTKKMAIRHINDLLDTRPTRHYISPEILIGMPFWVESDMWAFGCIAYELFSNEILFTPTRDNTMGVNSMHIISIIEHFGQFPKDMLEQGRYTNRYFINNTHKFAYLMDDYIYLHDILQEKGVTESEAISKFLGPIFIINPQKRITPMKCLQSDFLN